MTTPPRDIQLATNGAGFKRVTMEKISGYLINDMVFWEVVKNSRAFALTIAFDPTINDRARDNILTLHEHEKTSSNHIKRKITVKLLHQRSTVNKPHIRDSCTDRQTDTVTTHYEKERYPGDLFVKLSSFGPGTFWMVG